MSAAVDYRAIAEAAARAAIEIWEAKTRTVSVRHYGMKAIVEAIAKQTSLPAPSPTTVRTWVRDKGFPLDHDHIGMFVSQWALERWLAEVKRVKL